MFQKPRRNFISSYYKSQIVSEFFNLTFGSYGFVGLSSIFLNKKQMESIRILVTRVIRRRRIVSGYKTKQRGWMKFNTLFNVSITKKGSKSRMGKGKGIIDQHVYPIKAYKCFLELKNVPLIVALSLLQKINYKLGLRLALITKKKQIFYNS